MSPVLKGRGMEKDFFTALEVAARLRVELKTLQNRATGHEVYRPCQPGVYHRRQVDALVKAWSGASTPDEGLWEWRYELDRIRAGRGKSAKGARIGARRFLSRDAAKGSDRFDFSGRGEPRGADLWIPAPLPLSLLELGTGVGCCAKA